MAQDGLKVVGGTEAGKQVASKRRPLTSKQQAFADGVVSGLSQSEAYRRAYNAEGMKASAVHTEASTLAGHPEVSRRIESGLGEKERAALRSGLSRRAMVLERGLPPEAARRVGWATIHAVSLKQLADFDSPPPITCFRNGFKCAPTPI